MVIKTTIISIFIFSVSFAQMKGIEYSGRQFWAVSVPNVDSAAAWYKNVFDLKEASSVSLQDSTFLAKILKGSKIILEIVQVANSNTLADLSLKPGEGHKMQGLFKTGFYVKNIEQAKKYFLGKKVTIVYDIFVDKGLGAKSFVIQDPYGNLIQVFQEM